MRVSVIINTVNRSALLMECLQGLRQQTYNNMEVVVVVGPCEDDTRERLAEFRNELIILDCPELNLSVSRNIGIAASSGDICAFIDDDAAPYPNWVAEIAAPYADPCVGGVGGFTLDHTGGAFQCRYTFCNRLGEPHFFDRLDPSQFSVAPGSRCFPSLLGANSSFRRAELVAIGGFDEVFAYMLDETDVCLRLNDLGYRIATNPAAKVVHRYAPSHIRTPERVPKTLLPSARSKAYFCLKHRRDANDLASSIAELNRYVEDISFSNRWLVDHRKVDPEHFMLLDRSLREGVEEGMRLALNSPKPRNDLARHPARPQFKPLPRLAHAGSLRICLVSQGYPPNETAGIARWTHALAQALVAQGHWVHVIAADEGPRRMEFVAGVWVHRVPSLPGDGPAAPVKVPQSIYARALAVYNEAEEIARDFGLDILSAPIWDVEGLLCAAHLDIPVVTSLHTTYKMALPFKEAWNSDLQYRHKHVERVIEAETWLLRNSKLLLANSRAIVRSVRDDYRIAVDDRRVAIVPHGMEDFASRPDVPKRRIRKLDVLYVGRLEPRKGIDVLLEALVAFLPMHPDVHVRIVGEDVGADPKFFARLQALKAELAHPDLGDRVRFEGYIPDDELQRRYAECDIFVAPSRYESFGLIALEAMRYGKPVIAADAGGLGEVFEDGAEGLMFPNGDVAALIRALERLTTDAQLRDRLGRAARARFLRSYTNAAMAKSVAAEFKLLVGRGGQISSGATGQRRQ